MCQEEPSQPTSTGMLPPQHWAAQTAQGNDSDADSTLDADNASSTASITSSILHYRTIHGRSYHSEQGNAQYWGSNDEPQNEGMDINHHTLTLGIGGKLHLAPLEKDKVHRVIDIGTGTGIWAIDFADEFPGTEVIGTDISPIQPSWVPPNLKFEIEDCTQKWTFASDSADYVHMRWLVGSIKDWPALSAEAFRVCKPGGWVESHETSSIITSDDDTVDGDSAMGQWGKIFIEGSKKIGSSFTVVEDETQKKALEKAGFTNIQEFNFKNPLGDWPKDPAMKEMGRYTKFSLERDIEGTVLFMAHTLGWSRPEIQVYISQLRRELRSGKHHGYYRQKVVWGQKPETTSD
ncbi:hypothetical protein NM208_g7135 [Fusarium decemcellulare]|uniref:Uncharacterized protein n=1 Tax=Fusarium decemcellulare TaxID=57161 RepID=A0ACC1SAD6_9HYPO|nr:hypothetical protein NM208_g7135 [Fusarium decemcellulare]